MTPLRVQQQDRPTDGGVVVALKEAATHGGALFRFN
jgi:hypothetical protein